jgi:geranylgeranyl diphosphate synthase type II
LRRGKPTNHKVFGEAIAILAGDGLLNLGYEVLIRHALENPEDYEKILKAANEIATASGCKGIIGGQVEDILSQNTELTYEELKYIHEHKTAALIEASVCAGAHMAGASEKEVELLREYAGLIGLAFQIKDDILDVIGDEKTLGKKVGSDREKGKFTFVNIFGVEKSQEMVEELTDEAIKILDTFGERAQFLKDLSNYLIERVN